MKQARTGHSRHLNYLAVHPTALLLFILSRVAILAYFSWDLVQCEDYITSWRNDPALGAERPRNRGGTTAFGADVGRIDPGRIDSGADRPVPKTAGQLVNQKADILQNDYYNEHTGIRIQSNHETAYSNPWSSPTALYPIIYSMEYIKCQ